MCKLFQVGRDTIQQKCGTFGIKGSSFILDQVAPYFLLSYGTGYLLPCDLWWVSVLPALAVSRG